MGKEIMIRLGECELDYPAITRFKVWVGKVNMGEYDKGEMVKKFGDRANGNETGGWIGVERGE